MTGPGESLSDAQACRLAANPETPAQRLADIAYTHPKARPFIATNPATYDGLLVWLGAPGDPDVDSALARRARGGTAIAPGEETWADWCGTARRGIPSHGGTVAPSFPWVRAPLPTRKRLVGVIGGIVAVALVLGGVAAVAANPFGGHGMNVARTSVPPTFSTVTAHGNPPTGTFVSGVRMAWTMSAADLGYDGSHLSGVAETSTVWVLSIVSNGADNQQAGALVGLSAATGKELWHNDSIDGSCAGVVADSLMCLTGSGSYGLGDPSTLTLVRVAVADGTVSPVITLQQLGFAGSNVYVSLKAVASSVLLNVTDEGANGYTQPSTFTLARVSDDGLSLRWKTTQTQCGGGGDNWPSVARVVDGVLLLSDADSHEVLDFATGAAVADVGCQSADLFGRGGLLVAGAAGSASVTDPHRIHSLITDTGGTVPSTPVNFQSSADAPPVPVEFTSAADGTVTITAPTPDGHQSGWSRPVTMQGASGDAMLYGAADATHLVLVDTAGHVVSVDPATGDVLWTSSYAALHTDSSGAGYVPVSVAFGPGASVLISDLVPGTQYAGSTATFSTYVFDARSGRQLSSPAGWSTYESGMTHQGASREAIVPGVLPITGNAAIGAVIPLMNSGTIVAPPSPLPACPAGFTALSWTVIAHGHVLLCSGSHGYQATVRIDQDMLACNTVTFSSVSYRLGCASSRTVTVAGGGTIVQLQTKTSTSIRVGATGWATGNTVAGFGTAAGTIPDGCSSGAELLSLSQWKNGWLFVCGTDALNPSSLVFRHGSATETSHTVTYGSGRYCAARVLGGSVCASASPAVVSITSKNGASIQRAVPHNFFVSKGAGGAGQGDAAYGVTAPKDTAVDEVRYLEQILQKSTSGRTKAINLVNDIATCAVNSDDIQTATFLVANREELLSALASTPIDQIPSGSRLVTELTLALQASLAADKTYQTAVSDLNGNGCAQATQDMSEDASREASIGDLKKTFVTDWNTTIAGKYPSSSPFLSQQI